jgi:hypothetical protein
MSKSDLELRLSRWLTEGPTDAPSDVVNAALNEARQESQARVIGFPRLGRRGIALPGYSSLARAAVGAVAVIVVLAVALWSVNSSPVPPAASPTPSGLAVRSSEPSPSATGSTPTPRTSSPQATGDGLVITWKIPRGVSGLNNVAEITGSAQMGGRLVISGSRLIDDGVPNIKGITTYPAPALWWSDDAVTWHVAQLPSGYEDRQFSIGRIADVAAGGPGFVALGASLPIWSVDGESWSTSTGSGVPYPGRLSVVGGTSDGLIAYGFNSAIDEPIAVRSRDGRDWRPAADVVLRLAHPRVLFVESAEGLTVFASQEEPGKTDVWRMESLDSWVRLGTIDDRVGLAARSPWGWVAFGDGAWVSTDGASWVRAHNSPGGRIQALAGTSVGYVAVTATSTMGGCAIELDAGQTWTSVDGLDWQQMAGSQGWWLDELLVKGRTLIGIISPYDEQQEVKALIRTAELPTARPDERPAPTPTVTPTPLDLPGCGGG